MRDASSPPTSGDAALAFIEIGAVALVLPVLARLAGRLGITAIPFYLLAGLAVGRGRRRAARRQRRVHLAGRRDRRAAPAADPRPGVHGRRARATGCAPGSCPASSTPSPTSCPGFAVGLVLGWEPDGRRAARRRVLGELVGHRGQGARPTSTGSATGRRPAILNLLVIEDLAMAAYLPVAGALVAGEGVRRHGHDRRHRAGRRRRHPRRSRCAAATG